MFREFWLWNRKVMLGGVMLLCSLSSAQGALVYSNGGPDYGSGIGITNQRTVDDFSLAGSMILSSVRFWAVFGNNDPTGKFSGDVSWAIYNDAAGAVGSEVASGSLSGLSMLDIGHGGTFNFNAHQIDVNLGAVALGAGTYWLEVHEGTALNTSDGTETFWATSALSGGNTMTQSAFSPFPGGLTPAFNLEFAFELYGDADTGAVPEPGTALLLGAALAAIAARSRRK